MQRTIGATIKELRSRLGLTQDDIAERTGIGVTRVSDLERDRYKTPDTATLLKLAEALGCSIDDLLLGPDEDFRSDVSMWPLFVYVREQMAELQPYPDAKKWKQVITAYERAVSRGTMLLKAIDEIAAYIDRDAISDFTAEEGIPARAGIRSSQSALEASRGQLDSDSDLTDHGSEVQQSPHLKGDAVDPASAHRIERLERDLAEIKAQLSGSKDVARRLAHIAAGTKGHAARKSGAKTRKRGR